MAIGPRHLIDRTQTLERLHGSLSLGCKHLDLIYDSGRNGLILGKLGFIQHLVLDECVPAEVRKKVGGHLEKYLIPNIKKQAVDFLLQFLDMGTWTIVGDITRVYRGPNCDYKGWQKNSVTTPDLLFQEFSQPSENPFWAKHLELCTENAILVNCSPEESRDILINQVEKFYPGSRNKLEKIF